MNENDLHNNDRIHIGKCNSIRDNGICEHHGIKEKEIDELLESIWELQERGKITELHYRESGVGKVILESLPFLCKLNLVLIQDNHIKFTPEGENRAKNIVRRHRLAERMLVDLFDIPKARIEGASCEFEHILSEEVTDSICSFLGHPIICPHGKPIPRGECCNKIVTSIRPLVMPLSELMPGEKSKITFIATKDKHRLQRLCSLGIVPDGVLKVQQVQPVMVVRVAETEIALDQNLVSEIYVRRVNGS